MIAFVVGKNWEKFEERIGDGNNFLDKMNLEDDGVKGIDNLYETYKTNDLNINYFSYYAEPINEEYSAIDVNQEDLIGVDPSDYRISANYLKIYGLKNKEIENKINRKIKQYMLEQISFVQKYDYEHVNVWLNDTGNFANILSINVYVDVEFPWENTKSLLHGINFDLNTGEEIKFADVFTYDADIKNMLSDCAYQTLARDYELYGYLEMDEMDYSEVEDDVDRVLKKYSKNQDIEFTVSPSTITAFIGRQGIDIPIFEYKNQVSIYHRYLSNETLFENGNNEKGKINVLISESDNDEYNYHQVERVADNLFVSIQIDKTYYDWENTQEMVNIKEDYEEMLNYVNNKIEEYKQKNDGKARFYEISAYNYDPNSDIKYEINEVYFEGDSEYFENRFFPWAIKKLTNRMESGFIYEGDMSEKMLKHLKVENNNVYREDNSMNFEEYQEENEEYGVV